MLEIRWTCRNIDNFSCQHSCLPMDSGGQIALQQHKEESLSNYRKISYLWNHSLKSFLCHFECAQTYCTLHFSGIMVMVKLSLCLIKKTYRGVEVQLHIFLTLALDGLELSASHPSCFTPGERSPVPICLSGNPYCSIL